MKAKKIGLSLGILLVVLMIGSSLIGDYFYKLALDPTTDKSFIFEAEHNQSDGLTAAQDWFLAVEPEDFYIQSKDGLQLHAFHIEQKEPTLKYVVMAHGYTSNGQSMSGYAKQFYDHGYNILIPDARGHGESEGNYIGMGWHERLDLLQWVDELIKYDSRMEITLFGISMGAATVLNTAGEPLPENVKAIVEDCGYTSVHDIFAYQLKELFNLPSFPVLNFASGVTRVKAGYALGEAAPIKQVAKATVPILFIHGTEDSFVPYAMLDELYEAAPVEKEKLVVEGAGHAGAATVAPDTYWETVFNFLDKYL